VDTILENNYLQFAYVWISNSYFLQFYIYTHWYVFQSWF